MARKGMAMLDIALGMGPKGGKSSRKGGYDEESDPSEREPDSDTDDSGYDGESDGDQACVDDLVDAGFSESKSRAIVDAISALIERRG